jgi:hypothetical protein
MYHLYMDNDRRGSMASVSLERAYGLIRKIQPCLPPAVFVVLPASTTRKLGHFHGCAWSGEEGTDGSHEIAVHPDLFAHPEKVLATLLHEAAHALLHEWGLNGGVGPDGYYHREEFKRVCEKIGLECRFLNRRYGWSGTAWPSAGVPDRYGAVLKLLEEKLPLGSRSIKQGRLSKAAFS